MYIYTHTHITDIPWRSISIASKPIIRLIDPFQYVHTCMYTYTYNRHTLAFHFNSFKTNPPFDFAVLLSFPVDAFLRLVHTCMYVCMYVSRCHMRGTEYVCMIFLLFCYLFLSTLFCASCTLVCMYVYMYVYIHQDAI
jgi:hypothetical protein